MHLELRHLRLVSEIARLGSMTRAAERLHLTQSALSHQLRDIESRLGTALFLRVGRRLVLTPGGDRLLRTAERVIDEVARAEEDVMRLGTNGHGILRVCTQCNTGYHWLPPLLQEFRGLHPGVEVRLAVDATLAPIERLLEGRLDLALVTDPVDDPRIRVRPLFDDEMVALVSPSHPFARRRFVTPHDLASQHLLIYASSREQSFTYKHVLGPAGVEPDQVSFVQLTEAIVEMVKAGIGVGVLARWSVEPVIAEGLVRAVAITEEGIYRRWYAATLTAMPEPAWLQDFVHLLGRRALPARAAARRARRRNAAAPAVTMRIVHR